MNRIDHLNKHLTNLVSLNHDGMYEQEVQNTINEINKELGIGTNSPLSSYSTKELHEELVKRDGVKEVIVHIGNEAVIKKVVGDQDETNSLKGPARILINQD